MKHLFLLTCLPAAPLYLYWAMRGDYLLAAVSLAASYGQFHFAVGDAMQPEVIR